MNMGPSGAGLAVRATGVKASGSLKGRWEIGALLHLGLGALPPRSEKVTRSAVGGRAARG